MTATSSRTEAPSTSSATDVQAHNGEITNEPEASENVDTMDPSKPSEVGDLESAEDDESDDPNEEQDKKDFGAYPSHVDFIKMLRSAKKMADRSQTKVPVVWRGYKTSVLPFLPPFSTADLKERLKRALKGQFNLPSPERKVKTIKYLKVLLKSLVSFLEF